MMECYSFRERPAFNKEWTSRGLRCPQLKLGRRELESVGPSIPLINYQTFKLLYWIFQYRSEYLPNCLKTTHEIMSDYKRLSEKTLTFRVKVADIVFNRAERPTNEDRYEMPCMPELSDATASR